MCRMEKVTIYEIAKKVGLSPATVSRAIHSPHLLSPATLERIKRAMQESNYTYNAAAANLSRGSSSTIHVFIPAVSSSVFSATVMGVQEFAFKHFLSVVVSSTNYDSRNEIELLKQAREQRCAGILLTGLCKNNEARVLQLAKEGMPIVLMWEKGPPGLNSVGFDNYEVVRSAVEYLVSLGHRRIGAVFGLFSLFSRVQMRVDAYLDVLRENGLDREPGLYLESYPTIEDGKKAVSRLLKLRPRPTAIMCANDLQAMGAYEIIRKAGLRIPEDISVFGFDDLEVAPYLSPPLSTVHVPGYAIGKQAAKLLVSMLKKKDKPIVQQIVDTPLKIRQSCVVPPVLAEGEGNMKREAAQVVP